MTAVRTSIPVLRLARLLAVAALCLSIGASETQAQTVVLSGQISDAESATPLSGANVFVPALSHGTVTEADGRYRLEVPTGTYEVRYSYVGYEEQVRTISVVRDTTVDVALEPRAVLDRVEVVAEDDTAVDAPLLGVTRLEMRELQRLPTFMGEIDVTRSVLMLPGVTSVGEGTAGLNVRGGNVDQNLMLLDGAQVFFGSHLFGMFSAFNPDLLEDVTLYRGTIPARFGGRISSVLDIRQRDGREDRLGVSGGIGLVASRLAVEGPIPGDLGTVVVGGRASYVNWLTSLADRADVKASRAGYADLTARVALQPSSRLRAVVSGYLGTDSFRFGADTTYHYDTRNVSLRASYAASRQVSAVVEAALSSFRYGFGSEHPAVGFDFDAGVLHGRLQPAVVWALPLDSFDSATLESGVSLNYYRLDAGRLVPLEGAILSRVDLDREQAVEGAAYVSADLEFGRWRVDLGLRYGIWTTLGPAAVPVIDPSMPPGPTSVIDTLFVDSGHEVARNAGLEPRLGLRFALSDDTMLKAGYSRLRQNVHLLSNTTAPTPIDRWKLTDPHVPVQVGDQVAAGVQMRFPMGLQASLEGYYRWLYDVVTYRPGASLLLNQFVATDLLTGEGRAYGAEILIERLSGTFTGRLSYTLSRSERRTFAERPEEQVNFGEFFPADFDRPHDFALTVGYNESDWATWGITFVYSSGRPFTEPTGVYDIGGAVIPSYSLRNQARLPAYHRLDISFTVDAPRASPDRRYRGRWNATIYNIYGRRNAYSVFFREQPGTRIPQAYRISTFGTIMPSISYSFEF